MAGFTICKQQCIFKGTFEGPFLASAEKYELHREIMRIGFF